jgi:hypothetical protein
MPFNPTKTLTSSKIKPARWPEKARTQAVRLPAGVTYSAGQVLEEVTANSAQSEVQTLTLTGSPTGGSFILGWLNQSGGYDVTAAIAYNAPANSGTGNVQTILQALLGTNNVTVTGSAGGPWTLAYANELANRDVAQPVLITNGLTGGTTPSLTIATTTAGSAGAVGTFQAYSAGNARAVLEQNVRTDLRGCIIDEFGSTNAMTTTAFVSGEFFASDLVGLDSTAVPANGTAGTLGKLKSGASIAAAGAIVEIL